jgi:hypothetical protein
MTIVQRHAGAGDGFIYMHRNSRTNIAIRDVTCFEAVMMVNVKASAVMNTAASTLDICQARAATLATALRWRSKAAPRTAAAKMLAKTW